MLRPIDNPYIANADFGLSVDARCMVPSGWS